MREILTVLASSSLFSGLTETEIQEIQQMLHGERRAFERDECLLRAGDPAKAFGILLSGGALVRQEDFWGNRNILSEILPGHIFGEAFACSPGSVLNVSVFAEKESEVLWLSVGRILTTCPTACPHHSRMIRNLLSDLAEKNLRLNEKLTHMGQRKTREKIMSYLSSQAQKSGKSQFEIPFNRQQLADYLSVERSAMSLELSKLKSEGIIDFDKNRFKLL